MIKQTKKLRLIYFPFLIIAICIIGGYTFLNWLLFIKLQAFSLKEEIVKLWIPLVLPWIPILIWLRPKLNLLNLKKKRGDLPGIYIFIAGLTIVVPTLISQLYIEQATGKLIPLKNINQIDKQELSKYYSLKNSYINKDYYQYQSTTNVSGKHSQYYNINLYYALPILSNEDEISKSTCLAWYGIKYHKSISNKLDEYAKSDSFQNFSHESHKDFLNKDVNQFVYLERIGNTDDHDYYNIAIKRSRVFLNKSRTVLIPINEPFEVRTGNKLQWIFVSFAIGALVWLVMVLIPKFNELPDEKLKNKELIKKANLNEIFSFFIPREGFCITPIIIDLNILIYLAMVFSGLGFISFKGYDLVTWGANFKPYTTNSEPWRLVTCTFLHGGLMHLLANMYGLLFAGIFLEPVLGKMRYLIIYLSMGTLASCISLWWYDAAISVGASGAIFGLYGVFLALVLTNIFPKHMSKAFLTSTLIFVGYNLLAGLAGRGIDNAAHIGGLVSGFVCGLLLSQFVEPKVDDFIEGHDVKNLSDIP